MEIPKRQVLLNSLILLPANSHAKMAPDSHYRLRRGLRGKAPAPLPDVEKVSD
jgi:hypothetical protein